MPFGALLSGYSSVPICLAAAVGRSQGGESSAGPRRQARDESLCRQALGCASDEYLRSHREHWANELQF